MSNDIKAILCIIVIASLIELYPPLGYSLAVIALVTMILIYYEKRKGLI